MKMIQIMIKDLYQQKYK